MTFFEEIEKAQKEKNTLVCVGLDYDAKKLPNCLSESSNPLFEFNKAIIDATKDFVCCYKPNIAFYEALGIDALKSLRETVNYLHSLGIPVIVDAKRNDIGNTASAYAKGTFDQFGFDAMTVNPYMGRDSVEPFLEYAKKGIFILARTSNPGGADFQNLICDGGPLYERVINKCLSWDKNNNVGFVVGATVPEEMKRARELAPNTIFLVPGIGAQGGDIEKTITNGIRKDGLGLIINSSRGIIYASNGLDFAEKAREEAKKLRDEINRYR